MSCCWFQFCGNEFFKVQDFELHCVAISQVAQFHRLGRSLAHPISFFKFTSRHG
jgi:hypothetical protein